MCLKKLFKDLNDYTFGQHLKMRNIYIYTNACNSRKEHLSQNMHFLISSQVNLLAVFR